MRTGTSGKAVVFGLVSAATALALGATAFACTQYKGKMKVYGYGSNFSSNWVPNPGNTTVEAVGSAGGGVPSGGGGPGSQVAMAYCPNFNGGAPLGQAKFPSNVTNGDDPLTAPNRQLRIETTGITHTDNATCGYTEGVGNPVFPVGVANNYLPKSMNRTSITASSPEIKYNLIIGASDSYTSSPGDDSTDIPVYGDCMYVDAAAPQNRRLQPGGAGTLAVSLANFTGGYDSGVFTFNGAMAPDTIGDTSICISNDTVTSGGTNVLARGWFGMQLPISVI